MKNIFKGLFIGAAVLAMTSCVEETLVQFDPTNAVAPVLASLSGSYVLEDGGDFATFTWSEADFGVAAAVRYTLYASREGYSDRNVDYVDGVTSTSITVDAATINNVLISSFECDAYSPYEISFYVVAAIKSTSGLTDATLTSNTVSATLTPYPADVTYDCVYVTGALNGWVFTGPFLYNYENDGVNFQGVIDFTTDYASNEFKITDSPDWNNGNYGASDTTEGGDPDSYQFVDGSNDNVKVYRDHRYYHFTFDKTSLVIYKDYGFDAATVTVNGSDYEMTYHLGKQRFYVDVDNASGTAIGSIDGTQLITVDLSTSGNQRIYFDFNDLNNITLFGSASAYGTDEDAGSGGDDGDTHVNSTFMLSGEMTDSWANLEMTSLGNEIYVAYNVASEADQQYGFNDLDNVWWAACTALYNGVTLDSPIYCHNWNVYSHNGVSCDGTTNLVVPSTGSFDYWAIVNQGLHYLVEAGTTPGITPDTWGVVGTPNNWGSFGDFAMTEDSETGYLVYKNLVLVSGDEIKLRYNNDWGAGDYGSSDDFAANASMSLTAGGGNIAITKAGTYDVYFDQSGTAIWIMTAGYKPGETPASWGIAGTPTGWGDTDLAMEEISDGMWYYANLTVSDGDEIKFRYNNDWGAGDFGSSDAFVVGTSMNLAAGGSNIVCVGGTYDVYLDVNSAKAWFMNPGDTPNTNVWYIAGDHNSWSTSDEMTYENGLWVKKSVSMTAGQGFKFLENQSWDVNYGGPGSDFTCTIGIGINLYSGGANIAVPADGTYDIYFDENNIRGYVVKAGDTPNTDFWAISGDPNGWGTGTGSTYMTEEGAYWVYYGLTIESGQGFKFMQNGSWDLNYGSSGTSTNAALDLEKDGANISVAAGTYDIYLDLANLKGYVMDQGKTPADAK